MQRRTLPFTARVGLPSVLPMAPVIRDSKSLEDFFERLAVALSVAIVGWRGVMAASPNISAKQCPNGWCNSRW